jgi:hypothetical protein
MVTLPCPSRRVTGSIVIVWLINPSEAKAL